MKKILQNYFSLFQVSSTRPKGRPRKSKGQSLVEVAIAFPLLIMLFSGMVEFGFMLNTYLSLLDATRQIARFHSNDNPFITSTDNSTIPPTVTIVDDPAFYNKVAQDVIDILDPPSDPNARSIVFNPDEDDIIISVIKVSIDESTNPDTISDIERFPTGGLYPYYRAYGNQLSIFSDNAQIEQLMTANNAIPVRSGILIIEIHYGYEGVLKLPWVTAFMDTIMLHADTVMPLVSAKPPRTP